MPSCSRRAQASHATKTASQRHFDSCLFVKESTIVRATMEIEPSMGYNELSYDKKQNKPKWRFGRHGSKRSESASADYLQYNDSERFQEEDEEVYIVRQRWGYCSILFSVIQTIILAIMMIKCGVAPLNINPMIGPFPDVLSDWGGKNAVSILDDGADSCVLGFSPLK